MGYLTDRTFISYIKPTDLIHVVDPTDVSQGNPDGSSYKGSIQQVFDAFFDVFVTGGTYSNGTVTFRNNTGGTFNVTGFYTGGSDFYTVTGITTSQTLIWDKSYWGISGSSNVDLTLPSTVGKDGYFITIKDESGTCGTYRIRLTPTSGLIDGNSYVDMNINYMSLTVMVRNGNWYII
jgi:hypothetical protein